MVGSVDTAFPLQPLILIDLDSFPLETTGEQQWLSCQIVAKQNLDNISAKCQYYPLWFMKPYKLHIPQGSQLIPVGHPVNDQ